MKRAAAVILLALAACQPAAPAADDGRDPLARVFPRADRPVSDVVSNSFGNEDARDNRGEAQALMDWAGVAPGMTVADIGAGDGYYTVRLSPRVGADGRVLAQDIDDAAMARLGQRVERERLDNVSIKTGLPADPRLPDASFDRVLMVYMYHEIAEPYAFLWRLRPALRTVGGSPGEVIVLDNDRPTDRHGTPPKLLFCEMAAVGYRLTGFTSRPDVQGYFARFAPDGPRPEPGAIKPCAIGDYTPPAR